MMIAGVATVVARRAFGALLDSTPRRQGLIIIASATVASGALIMSLFPTFVPVAIAQTAVGIADAVFPSAIAAVSLGILGPKAFTRRVCRNKAFPHAGTAPAALAAGVVGWLIAPGAVVRLVAILAVASIWATSQIDAGSIDHALARGTDRDHAAPPTALRSLLGCRPLLMFVTAILLFHFANAAMLPLLGEKLALGNKGTEALFMAACIMNAQIVMVPIAVLVGHKVDLWGRKPIFLVGFAVLPLRGVLYALTQNRCALVSIPIFDGIGAGIFAALFLIITADLTKGTGRYNIVQAGASAAWGLGAALSNAVAALMVDSVRYNVAFLFFATVALAALTFFWISVPENGSGIDRWTPNSTNQKTSKCLH